VPLDCAYPYTSACISGNLAYVYSFDNTFRSYDPAGDTWSLKREFPGPARSLINLVSLNNKIYLVGAQSDDGMQLMDCWEFDVAGNTWKLNSFLPYHCITGFAASFQNSLLSGLGYGLSNPLLYRMTP